MTVACISDPGDERVKDYFRLTDVALRRVLEPEQGLYLAESEKVIRRALAAGHRPRSYLMAHRWLDDLGDLVQQAGNDGVPVYVADHDVIEAMTGFHLHRGALASMHRPTLRDWRVLAAEACRPVPATHVLDHTDVGPAGKAANDPRVQARSRLAILDSLVDHTNVGACFRSAAAMGVDAVLVTPRCADPLYRRAIRVSMGTVFQVPWTRIDPWPSGVEELQAMGYVVAGMTLADDAMLLDDLVEQDLSKLALVFGAEGDGLSARTSAALDQRVKIPMMGGVDSLNVAASSAVAFYATR